MRKLKSPAKLDSLAMHVATGGAVADWAAEHKVSVRVAYTWLRLAETEERVSAIRAQLIDAGVGKLVSMIKKATHEIDRIIGDGATDNVRLAASRGALSDAMAMYDFANLDRRIRALEEGRAGHAPIERVDSPSLPT